jgi:hypothetical protein
MTAAVFEALRRGELDVMSEEEVSAAKAAYGARYEGFHLLCAFLGNPQPSCAAFSHCPWPLAPTAFVL